MAGPANWYEGGVQGASMGSAAGPWGALIGGAAGATHGLINSGQGPGTRAEWEKAQMGTPEEQQRKMLMDFYSQVQGRQPSQMGDAAQSGYSGFRSNQSDLVGRLEAMSKGQGPSLAAQQFSQATDRNRAGQQSMAQSGMGGPLAAFNAANNMGQLGAQAAQGSAMARTQEQQMALDMLGKNISAGRGADESNNQFNAGQQNQHAIQNLDARLRSMGMDDKARLEILAQMGGNINSAADRAAQKPSMLESLMAGGAGAFAQYAASKGQAKGATAQAPANTGSGGYATTQGGGGMTPQGYYNNYGINV